MKNYYPNDLMHGVLAAHVADETGTIAGKCSLKAGYKVEFKNSSLLSFLNSSKNREHKIDLNSYTEGWRIVKVIDDEKTGYLGIIYSHDINEHLVLAHRSTNFALAFPIVGSNFFKESGFQADIDGVLRGMITNHQGVGFEATSELMRLRQQPEFIKYSVSTTGHSLGAWLAELSTFYSYKDFNYNLKGVTFDGPGSRNMIEQMDNSWIERDFNLQNLDITSYLSAPNIVNCTNHHFGNTYRLFPDIPQDEGSFYSFIKSILNYTGKEGIVSTFGHDLQYIIPYFNPITGRPDKCEKIIKWPLISHERFGTKVPESQLSLISSSYKVLKEGIIKPLLEYCALNYENSFSSLLQFVKYYIDGQVNEIQFWITHDYLDPNKEYKIKVGDVGKLDSIEGFTLAYKGNYKCEKVDWYRKKIKDPIDKVLSKLIKMKPLLKLLTIDKELQTQIEEIISKYTIQTNAELVDNSKIIVIKENQRKYLTVAELRGWCRKILECKAKEYEQLKEQQAELKDRMALANYWPHKMQLYGKEAVLLLGNTGVGKSTLAHYLNGSNLQAVLDDDTGEIKIVHEDNAAVYSEYNVNIGHLKRSETKIPSKIGECYWDCPGFHDTNIVQSIVNSFVLHKLMTSIPHLKFVFVVSEASIQAERGTGFVKAVKQFMNCFTNPEQLLSSVALVVSQVPHQKKMSHVENNIKKILAENQHLTAGEKVLIENLLTSISIFHKPKEEGDIEKAEQLLLQQAIEKVNFVSNETIGANLNLLNEAKEYANQLLAHSASSLLSILSTIQNTIENSEKFLSNNDHLKEAKTSLLENHENFLKVFSHNCSVDQLKPIEPVDKTLSELISTNEEVRILAQEFALKSLKLGENNKEQLAEYVTLLLNTVIKFCKDDNDQGLQKVVSDYSYMFEQQLSHIEFFQKLVGQETDYRTLVNSYVQQWTEIIQSKFEGHILGFSVRAGQGLEYYNTLIHYMGDIREHNDVWFKKMADIYSYQGDYYLSNQHQPGALKAYVKALQYNKQLNTLYVKVGDILEKAHYFDKAVECYKAVNNYKKTVDCFKKVPDSLEKYVNLAEFMMSQGNISKAVTAYNNAVSYAPAAEQKKYKMLALNASQEQAKIVQGLMDSLSSDHDFNHYDNVSLDHILGISDCLSSSTIL